MAEPPPRSKVCFLSSFPPRECGIATFTRDVAYCIDKRFNPKLKSRILALNDKEYQYDDKVILTIDVDKPESYKKAAEKINKSNNIKIVSIQHEFGLYGGKMGSYILEFLNHTNKPVIVTFHSVLPKPSKTMKYIVQEIAKKAAGIIVMANAAVDILKEDYEIPEEKIHVIYHGVPNVAFQKQAKFKEKLNLQGRKVLCTFGLLSRGKGIEYMIQALPELVEKYPNLLYIIVGATHPNIIKKEGEKYRQELESLVEKLSLKNNVLFVNKYVSLKELLTYILASDIYICTNLSKKQIVSGTLSYALGCGRAVISTPSIYAKEILPEKGLIVKLKNPESYKEAIDSILGDEKFQQQLEKNAYSFSRRMTWPNIAFRYLEIFNNLIQLKEKPIKKYPPVKLTHLNKLTDTFGCIQFSNLTQPDKSSGYTVDDNARALIAVIMHHKLYRSKKSLRLAEIYLSFLKQAQKDNGNFKNNFYNENESLKPHSEDAFGRTLWALGYASKYLPVQPIWDKAWQFIDNIKAIKAKSFCLIGLCHYYLNNPSPEYLNKINELASYLCKEYKKNTSKDWRWFEPILSYSNSKIPESLFLAYHITRKRKYLKIAESSLRFLYSIVFINDMLYPVGEHEWYKRGEQRSLFDQQPLDASSIVQTSIIAYQITKKKEYLDKAELAFNWFFCNNHLKQMMYDEVTGGCYDGLGEHAVNPNQGAESTISYLLARMSLDKIRNA
ncbi:MAG: glycosyltransferase family 4 protein [Candidatus Nanoarchaeia archaeon]